VHPAILSNSRLEGIRDEIGGGAGTDWKKGRDRMRLLSARRRSPHRWRACSPHRERPQESRSLQLPVARWHEQIGDPTIADGILDRLVHNAHRIEMRGESMRKKRNLPRDENDEKKE
jgi:hypothetical protein